MKASKKPGSQMPLLLGLLIFGIPLIVSALMRFSVFKWMSIDNDWIGFWGAYLGGLFTLVGVFLTLRHSRKAENEKQKISKRPYIAVSDLNRDISFDDNNQISKNGVWNQNIGDNYLLIKDFLFVCKFENVGLGPAIQLTIIDFNIGGKPFPILFKTKSVLRTNEVMGFRVSYSNLSVCKNELSPSFLEEINKSMSNKHKHPDFQIDLRFKFSITYEDILGNTLVQEVQSSAKVLCDFPIVCSAIRHWSLDYINKPNEI